MCEPYARQQYAVQRWSLELVRIWAANRADSYSAFDALLQLLTAMLDNADGGPQFAEMHAFLGAFADESLTVRFLREALPRLIDEDFVQHTDCIDRLLMHLTVHKFMYDDSHLLDRLVRGTDYFAGFYLRQHEKRFHELFTYVRSNRVVEYDVERKMVRVAVQPHYLSCMHFEPKKIIVSNAPPVRLKRRQARDDSQPFECQVSAGGLVSGLSPALRANDVWVSYLEAKLLDLDGMPSNAVPKTVKHGIQRQLTSRRSVSLLRFPMKETSSAGRSRCGSLAESAQACGSHKRCDLARNISYDLLPPSAQYDLQRNTPYDLQMQTQLQPESTHRLYVRSEQNFLALQRLLTHFSRRNFVVNPLIIMKEDHRGFYDGIANGLLWPAFHNLREYVIDDYRRDPTGDLLESHWIKYTKVNYHFAIHAARSCRTQDFIWIHDYHLLLVGSIIRALDPSLDCGFFLHIPFRLDSLFIAEYPTQGMCILRALLGFTRVGFQTNRDALNFVRLLQRHVRGCEVKSRQVAAGGNSLRFVIQHQEGLTSVGVFPISIDTHSLCALAQQQHAQAGAVRTSIMGTTYTGKLFLSVERFDYTKGILQRLNAIDVYFEQHPDRLGKDLFYQVACVSRGSVSSYRDYQQRVIERTQQINLKYGPPGVIFLDTSHHPQETIIRLYKAADILVVTPLADGMNLVIKEAIISNPHLVFVLSVGSGAENQLYDAGLGDCYLRVRDVEQPVAFADMLSRATHIPIQVAKLNGQKMYDYTKSHDIMRWLDSFCDLSWTHYILPQRPIDSLTDIQKLTSDLEQLRRRATYCVCRNVHMDDQFAISSDNALCSLENAGFEHDCIASIVGDIKLDTESLQLIRASAGCASWLKHLNRHDRQPEQLQRYIPHPVAPADLAICVFEPVIGQSRPLSLQTFTAGVLISRFFFRFASTTIFVSTSLTVDEMRDRCVFPYNFATLIGRDGAIVRAAGDGRAGIRGWLDRASMGLRAQLQWSLMRMKILPIGGGPVAPDDSQPEDVNPEEPRIQRVAVLDWANGLEHWTLKPRTYSADVGDLLDRVERLVEPVVTSADLAGTSADLAGTSADLAGTSGDLAGTPTNDDKDQVISAIDWMAAMMHVIMGPVHIEYDVSAADDDDLK